MVAGFSSRSAEHVALGHPDRTSDYVADSVLDTMLQEDPLSHLACEVLLSRGGVVVAGEAWTNADIDVAAVVREALTQVGYTSTARGIDVRSCEVSVHLVEQARHLRDVLRDSTNGELCAGDQVVATGFARRNQFGMIPAESYLAKRLSNALDDLHRTSFGSIGPDGKTMVTLRYEAGVPAGVSHVVVSTPHSTESDASDVLEELANLCRRTLPSDLLDGRERLHLNPPNGCWTHGGPAVDTGLTGRKLVADAYGPSVPIGGGALSGKDCSKIDRTGAYAARWVALSLVGCGLVDEALVSLTYVIGESLPSVVEVVAPALSESETSKLRQHVLSSFDLRPAALVESLSLRTPLFRRAVRGAHFGLDNSLPWELPRRDL